MNTRPKLTIVLVLLGGLVAAFYWHRAREKRREEEELQRQRDLTRPPTKEECVGAVSSVVGDLFPHAGGKAELTAGSWDHIPTGCSVDPGSGRPHWNVHPDGATRFPLVCRKGDRSWYATAGAKQGQCDTGRIAETQEALQRGSENHTHRHLTRPPAKEECAATVARVLGGCSPTATSSSWTARGGTHRVGAPSTQTPASPTGTPRRTAARRLPQGGRVVVRHRGRQAGVVRHGAHRRDPGAPAAGVGEPHAQTPDAAARQGGVRRRRRQGPGGLFPHGDKFVVDGAWGHIPSGCSVDPNSGKPHWNAQADGSAAFPVVCRKEDGSWYATGGAKQGQCDATAGVAAETKRLLQQGYLTRPPTRAECTGAVGSIVGGLFPHAGYKHDLM